MDDRELVARVLRGEMERMGEVVMRFDPVLRKVAWPFFGNNEDTEDAVQQAWDIIINRLPRYEPGRSSLGTWLCSVTIGLCWHLRRRWARRARAEEHERCCCLTEPLSPEERHESLVWHERLWAVLRKLSRLEQTLLILHLQEDWTYRQVGLVLSLSERQVEYRTRAAIIKAQKLGEELRRNHWRFDGAN